jgi:hypothetical protein
VCTVALHVTVNNTEILSAEKKLYGGLMSPANIKMYLGLHVKCLISLSDLKKKIGMSRHVLISVSSIKFKGNLSSGSRADTCGQTDKT